MTQLTSFAGSSYSLGIMNDERIPDGKAIAVALAIASRVRWGEFRAEPSVNATATRMGVTPEYVRDCVELLILLGYLIPAGINTRRQPVYTPALPFNASLAPTHSRQPIDKDLPTNAEAA